MSTLKIVATSDESVKYEIDETELIETDHEVYGWEAMGAVDVALRRFAEKVHMEIVEEGMMPI